MGTSILVGSPNIFFLVWPPNMFLSLCQLWRHLQLGRAHLKLVIFKTNGFSSKQMGYLLKTNGLSSKQMGCLLKTNGFSSVHLKNLQHLSKSRSPLITPWRQRKNEFDAHNDDYIDDEDEDGCDDEENAFTSSWRRPLARRFLFLPLLFLLLNIITITIMVTMVINVKFLIRLCTSDQWPSG